MTAPSGRNGRVVTFYSYKGGTGRSMALSNMAWILASAGKRVLMIDWDLEAPGLHRYFRPFLIDHELGSSEGLIDLIDRYASEAIRPPPEGQTLPDGWWAPLADISEYVLGIDFDGFPSGGRIDLLPAGRQCETYAVKVSAFNWQNFFDRLGGGGFLDAVRLHAKAEYDYVLIDSRTGVSDTAGICTAQMPDTLVVCFTYNNQSVKGAAAVAASSRKLQAELAEERRRAMVQSSQSGQVADSPMPFRIFPVPMRVDAGESDRLALRQAFARETFSRLMDPRVTSDVASYWSAVEVPHRVFYSYEEVLAPFKDDAHDPKTVLSAFVRLTGAISDGEVAHYRLPIEPARRQLLLEAYAETPQSSAAREASVVASRETEDEALIRHVESVLQSLNDEDRAKARSVMGRLVRIGRDDEGGGVFPIRVAMAEIHSDHRSTVAELAQRSVLAVASELRPGANNRPAPEQIVAPAHDRMFSLSPTLQAWLAEDREFLLWRQQLRAYRTDWDRSGDPSALLSGSPLAEARLWSRKRGQDLNELERDYVDASIDASHQTTSPASGLGPPESSNATSSIPIPAPRKAAPAQSWRLVSGLAMLALVGGVVYALLVLMPSRDVAGPPDTKLVPLAPVASLVHEADKLYEQGQLAAADAAYRRVLEREADNGHALLQLGRINDRNGDYAASAALYQRAIALQPKEAQPRIERAASLISQGRFTEAQTDLNVAIENDPNNALAYFNRGVANENLRRSREATIDYSAAIRLNQGMVPAFLRRAALNEKSDLAAARADYQSVLGLPALDNSAQTAQERLTALGGPVKQAGTNNQSRVYIQYSDAADKTAVESLRKALVKALEPISLPGIEKVSVRSDGEVRFFFAEDRDMAQRVANAAESQLAKAGTARQLKLTYRDAKAFPNATRGTVEIWLPSLAFVAPSRGIRPDALKK